MIVAALAVAVATPAPAAADLPGEGFLPNGRVWEMVSPPDKNGGSVLDAKVRVSPSGDAVSFSARQAFSGASSSVPINNYVALRGPDGWSTRSLLPPYFNQGGVSQPLLVGLSEDLSQAALASPDSDHPNAPVPPDPDAPTDCYPLHPTGGTGCINLYLRDTASGDYRLMTTESEAGELGNFELLGFFSGTPDYGHVLFRSLDPQVPGVSDDEVNRLYEHADGLTRLVGVDLGGAPFEIPQQAGHDMAGESSSPWQTPPISDDGSRIYLTASFGGPGEVYLREDASETHHVTESERTVPDDTGEIRYVASSRDGGRALLTGTRSLVDADAQGPGGDLYLYQHSDDPASDANLTLISDDEEPADGLDAGIAPASTAQAGSGVGGILGISDDGGRVYFATAGQLVAGEPTAPARKLYLWDHNDGDPTLTYIAGLSDSDDDHRNWSTSFDQLDRWPVDQVTPDGERMVLTTAEPLRADQDGDTDDDVYLYDAGADELQCVSCQAPGAPSAGGSLFRGALASAPAATAFPSYNVSSDGRRVYFDSPDALVAKDGNGRRDVYQWEDGALSLISSGQSGDASMFLGASADGDRVFFRTRDRLSSWDVDANFDVYVASVGGGLPEPDAASPCAGDGCQGLAQPAPPTAILPTNVLAGRDPLGSPRPVLRVGRIALAQRRRFARTGRLTLHVRPSRAGRMVVRFNRGRDVSSRVGARTQRLTLRLSRSARRELSRSGRLRVRIVVRVGAERRALSFVLRSAK